MITNFRNYTISDKEDVHGLLKQKLSYSKYNPIVVRIKNIKDRKKFFDTINWYGIFPSYLRRTYKTECDYIIILKELTNSISAPFRVLFTDDYEYYDSGDFMDDNPTTYPKLLTPDELDGVLEELLGIPDAKSMYKPKKIVRSIETVDEGVSHWTYRYKTEEEFEEQYGANWREQIQYENPSDVGVSWAHDMDYLIGLPCDIEDIDMTENQRYHLPTDKNSRGYWIITNEMLTKNKQIVPSYSPRKIDRTLLESLRVARYNYVVVRVENWDEFILAQTTLFKKGYIWITGNRQIQYTNIYPTYIFVIGHSAPCYKNKFFYEEECNLDGGSVEETILTRQFGSERDKICPKTFRVRDIENLPELFDFKGVPSYSPRRVDRTMESYKGYDYDSVVIALNNETEVDIAKEHLNKYKYAEQALEEIKSRFKENKKPSYIRVNFGSEHDENEWFMSHGTIDFLMEIAGDNEHPSFEKIYTVNDLKHGLLKNITQHSKPFINPSYSPRRVDRTLESMINYPYRVKTEKELIDEYGPGWKRKLTQDIGWSERMVNLFGTVYQNRFINLKELGQDDWLKIYDENGIEWTITPRFLTKNDLGVPSYTPKKIERTLESTEFEQSVIKKIQSVLTLDLLNPEWSEKLKEGKHHPFAGHCYAASEALYHLLGGKEKGYKPMRGKGLNDETHWWIVDKDGNILDSTSEQFYFVGLKPPYKNGKGTGFLTKSPSKRAKEIISRIQNI
jgi:hypothetical protein